MGPCQMPGETGARKPLQQPEDRRSALGVLLVIGSGDQLYREYMLASAAQEHPLWLIDDEKPTWQAPYLAGSSVTDIGDPAALLAVTRQLADQIPINGVFCYYEPAALTAAHVVESLGLPGMDPVAVWRCRDKHQTRQILTAANVPQPASVAVGSYSEACAAAQAIGWPLVLKPRALGASQGVVLVRSASELPSAYATASSASHPRVPAFRRGVLVEQYVDGPEISVDGMMTDGRHTSLFLARKVLGEAPYFEEIAHIVDPVDPLLEDAAISDLLRVSHKALALSWGITHTEIRLTSGGPVIIEVNPRFAGDLLPHVARLATGIDSGTVGAQVALGRTPLLCRKAIGTAGIRFVYPSEDCAVRTIRLPIPGESDVLESSPLAEPGEILRVQPRGFTSRYGYVISMGKDRADCKSRLLSAAAQCTLEYERMPPTDSRQEVEPVAIERHGSQ